MRLLDNKYLVEPLLTNSLGIITDVDGTISPIVPKPDEAKVTAKCRYYLNELSKQLPLVAAVSGRQAEIAKEMVGVESMVIIGNHGYERLDADGLKPWPGSEGYIDLNTESLHILEESINKQGIIFEDKGIIVAIHYRLCEDTAEARKFVLNAISNLPMLNSYEIKEGKMVIELHPRIEVTKGTAILSLIKEYPITSLIYLGDDSTDVDAFKAIRQWSRENNAKSASIAVLSDEAPADLIAEADYHLYGVNEVELFLEWIAGRYSAEAKEVT